MEIFHMPSEGGLLVEPVCMPDRLRLIIPSINGLGFESVTEAAPAAGKNWGACVTREGSEPYN